MAQPSSAASAPNVQVAALQERLNEKLKHTTAFCDLPLGHEQAIRIVDTDYFECVCCPAPRMHSNGKRMLGIALGNALRHVGAKEHEKHVELWVKAKNKERALRRLRLFARMAGRVLVWPGCGTLAPLSARMHQVDVGLRLLVPRLRHTKGCSVSVSKHTCRLVRVTPYHAVCGGVRVGL